MVQVVVGANMETQKLWVYMRNIAESGTHDTSGIVAQKLCCSLDNLGGCCK